ncbi:MAG: COX15/CtaA family protein [Pseudomonadota bacterium]
MAHTSVLVWWLRVVALFVVATLVVGGATRLTDSGLSITKWEPIVGILPPLSGAGWEEALALYRQIPEYQLINRGMSMADFQVIYLWEWGHRLIARTIGLVFALPLIFFWVTGRLPGWFKPWGLVLLALGGLQGVVGWWMVTSGLTERVDVSQYRLAVHLTLACVILALIAALSERLAGRMGTLTMPFFCWLTATLLPIAILLQISLGALVAGIDAGLASNTWPLMAGAFIPEGLGALTPAWLNAFENPLTVQFNHRMAGYVVVVLAAVHAVLAVRANAGRRGALAILALALAQVATGVLVVLHEVPALLAGTHQFTAAIMVWVATVHATRCARQLRAQRPVPAATVGRAPSASLPQS